MGVKPSEDINSKVITDGGALLWSCNWTKGEKLSKIFQTYIDIWRKMNIDSVVFDGYKKLSKDATHI